MSTRLRLSLLLLLLIFALPMLLRSYYESHSAFYLGESALKERKINLAIDSFQVSVSWWVPFVDTSEQSLQKLMQLGEEASLSKEVRLKALRAAKRGIMSSRSFLLPLSKKRSVALSDAARKIHALSGVSERRVREDLRVDPNYAWQLIALISFSMWVFFILTSIWQGFSRDGQIERSKISPPLLSGGFFFLLWLVSLSLA